MATLYPRTVTITRPGAQVGVGALGYGGASKASETAIASGLPASIQYKRDSIRSAENLPGDLSKRTVWRIFIPASALANGAVVERDIVTDDLGNRFQVAAPYWNILGYSLTVEKLEV